MKKVRKNVNLKYGQKVSFDMYADGSLTSVEAEVQADDGGNVSVKFYHPIYFEAGPQIKVLPKKALYLI